MVGYYSMLPLEMEEMRSPGWLIARDWVAADPTDEALGWSYFARVAAVCSKDYFLIAS
jgi:hypothetical protein